jgi:septal ring factor EnvC (AmiA/AmiB activator)
MMTDTQILARFDTLEDRLRQLTAEFLAIRSKLSATERDAQNERESLLETINQFQERQVKLDQGIAERDLKLKDLEKELEKNKTVQSKHSHNSNKYIKIAVEKALKGKSRPLQTTDDSVILKEELDNYIQEIERCIAELSE